MSENESFNNKMEDDPYGDNRIPMFVETKLNRYTNKIIPQIMSRRESVK